MKIVNNRHFPCFWICKINIFKMATLLKAICWFNITPTKIPMAFLTEPPKYTNNTYGNTNGTIGKWTLMRKCNLKPLSCPFNLFILTFAIHRVPLVFCLRHCGFHSWKFDWHFLCPLWVHLTVKSLVSWNCEVFLQ